MEKHYKVTFVFTYMLNCVYARSRLQVGFYDDNHYIFESYRDLKVKHFHYISQRVIFFLFLEILLINVFAFILL